MCHGKTKSLKLKAAENSEGKMMFIVNSEDEETLKQWVDIHVCGRGVETNSCSNGNIGNTLSTCFPPNKAVLFRFSNKLSPREDVT